MEINNSNLIPMIEKIATDIANRIVEQKLNEAQYKPPKVPDHHHNGTDSIALGTESMPNTFLTLPSTTRNVNGVEVAGVVNPAVLGNQIVTQGSVSVGYGTLGTGYLSQKGTFNTYTIPIIYGHGGGTDSQFNGGDAPEGTLLCFNNGAAITGLWVRSAGSWFGIGQATAGYTSSII